MVRQLLSSTVEPSPAVASLARIIQPYWVLGACIPGSHSRLRVPLMDSGVRYALSILNHYNALNQPTLTQLGNGTRTTREYFAWNAEHPYRLWKIYSGPDADTDAYQYYRYDYDAVGNITAIRDVNDSDQLVRFTYDALDRLTQAYTTVGGTDTYSHTYTYNQIGNLTALGGVTQVYTDTAHVHAVRSEGSNSYQYDDRGNMTQRVVGGDTWNYTYDNEGHLLTVSGPVNATYTHDAEGRLAKSVVGGVTNYYFSQWGEQLNGTKYHYFWLGGKRVARGSYSSGVTYLYGDQLGSTGVTRGASAGTQLYDPYGATRYGGAGVAYQYTGQRNEANLGIYYYGARWYDPSIGRFMQADTIVPNPANPQSLNRYSYVLNNPLRYTDPTGMIEEDEQEEAYKILEELYQAYGATILVDWYYKNGVFFKGLWSIDELKSIKPALDTLGAKYSSIDTFKQATGRLYIGKWERKYSEAHGNRGLIWLCSGFAWQEQKELFTTEVVHVIDWRSGTRGTRLSDIMAGANLGTIGAVTSVPQDPLEDLADAVTGFLYPDWANAHYEDHIEYMRSLRVPGINPITRDEYVGSPKWNWVNSNVFQ